VYTFKMAVKFKMINAWEAKYIRGDVSLEERHSQIESNCQLSDTPFPSRSAADICEMPWYEEMMVCIFWFALFALVLYGPFVLLILLYIDPIAAITSLALLFGFSYWMGSSFEKTSCYSYISTLMLKYFSYRGVWRSYPDHTTPFIGVGPPHGLFPFGALAGALAIPRFGGYHIRGIAASAVLSVPIIGNLLKIIGCVDASRHVVRSYLHEGHIIGISSGGIAEIFETDSTPGAESECIILKSRGGICKMALQTGCDILPSYLFGNSKALHVWHDPFGVMSYLSRKFKISLVFFWGEACSCCLLWIVCLECI
jgi:hypothetical protein